MVRLSCFRLTPLPVACRPRHVQGFDTCIAYSCGFEFRLTLVCVSALFSFVSWRWLYCDGRWKLNKLNSLLHLREIRDEMLMLRVGAQGAPYTATISYLLYVPIWVLTIPDSSTRALWQLPAEIPSSGTGDTWQEMAVNFAYEVSLSYM
jgi:hypothetical protein